MGAPKTDDPNNPFIKFVERFKNDRREFVRRVFGVSPDPWQDDVLKAMDDGDTRISIRSGHGVGKTSLIAWIIIHFMLTRMPTKIAVTAPTAPQLFDALAAEAKMWLEAMVRRLPAFSGVITAKAERLELTAAPEACFTTFRTSRKETPEALQGIHCFAEGTVDVLTRAGWRPLEAVTLDDEVLTKRVGSNDAAYERPAEVIRKPYSGEMFSYEGRFLRFLVTPNHKFEYEHRQCNKLVSGNTERWVPQVREIQNMQRGINRIPTTFRVDQPDVATYTIPAYVSRRCGYDYPRPAREIPMDDWVSFLGWYVAEGYISKSKYGPAGVGVCQSLEANTFKFVDVFNAAKNIGFSPKTDKNTVHIHDAQLARHVVNICPGKALEKRIPPFVFSLSPRQMRIFLDSFRAGDGCGDTDYITASPGLADDLQRLLLLSGTYATINVKEVAGTTMTAGGRVGVRRGNFHRVREWHGRSVDTAYIRSDKLQRVHYEGAVACLTVPSGMFYVRDRKTTKGFWTHNSKHTLLIADEASGVDDAVFEAATGSMSTPGAITILAGNPTRRSGFFFNTHTKLADKWRCFQVSCIGSPRVDPEFIKQIADTYGVDSQAYRVRVLGEFPLEEEESFIPWHIVDESAERDVSPEASESMFWGLDVARYGADASALAKRRGNTLIEPTKTWRNLDTMQLVGAVRTEFDATPKKDQPEEIFVDVIGIGAGVADRLRELGLPCIGVNVAESPSVTMSGVRLRDDLWDAARQWFMTRNARIPLDEPLISELTTPRVTYTSQGKIKIESKDEMKRRGKESPNRADAFCLTFARGGAVAAGVSTKRWRKGEPLRRRNTRRV